MVQTPESLWYEKEFRSQSQARKTTCHAQKWKYGKATHRSRKRWIKKKRPEPINQSINKASNLSQKIPYRNRNKENKDLTHSINNTNSKMSNRDPLIPDVPFHPGTVYKPPPELIKQNVSSFQLN